MIENNWLIEQVFRYEKVRALQSSLRLVLGIKLESKMNFVEGISYDFVFKNSILIYNSL
jgi:hypothetical protein